MNSINSDQFRRELLNLSDTQKEGLLTKEEVDNIIRNNIRFDESYRRGVHETWGSRGIIVYDILYRIINKQR